MLDKGRLSNLSSLDKSKIVSNSCFFNQFFAQAAAAQPTPQVTRSPQPPTQARWSWEQRVPVTAEDDDSEGAPCD